MTLTLTPVQHFSNPNHPGLTNSTFLTLDRWDCGVVEVGYDMSQEQLADVLFRTKDAVAFIIAVDVSNEASLPLPLTLTLTLTSTPARWYLH